MKSARCFFNPCSLQDTFYLCGGFTTLCECFRPISETFTPLPMTLEEESESTAVVRDNQLIVMTKQTLMTYSVDGRQIARVARPLSSASWSMSGPVVVGDVVFLVVYNMTAGAVECKEISLARGEVIREVRLNQT